MKKIKEFLTLLAGIQAESKCELAQKGLGCFFINSPMKCIDCPYFEGEEDGREKTTRKEKNQSICCENK